MSKKTFQESHDAAAKLIPLIEVAGGTVDSYEVRRGVDISVDSSGRDKEPVFWQCNVTLHIHYEKNQAAYREDVVSRLYSTIPGVNLVRNNGSMTLWGDLDGVTYYLWAGDAACERVQVGTRKVLKPAPDAPMVEVEEPVYEVRCLEVAS